MNYLSLTFALFVIASLIIYYLVPKKMRGSVLLISSIVFYISFDYRYIFFLLFTATTTYIAARLLPVIKKKKTLIFTTIALNTIMWFVIKMLPWTTYTIERVLTKFGVNITLPTFNLIIPIGISYYVLQAIGYLVDTYRGKTIPEKSFWKYFLFLSYFPAIVQGPISRYDELMPKLLNKNKFNFDNFRYGLLLISFGLIKKMVIADRIGIFVNYCFDNYSSLNGIILYLGAISYSIQIFADFSGCVDLCRGVSKIFGINLIHNFNRPYLSNSIKDFWGRWHMSFSSWLKDYIYIPLGGNRLGKIRKYINIIITFFVSGLWHGAGFNYIFWGLLHALYQILGDILFKIKNKLKGLIGIELGSKSDKIYKVFMTFNLVTFAWIFFRSDGLMEGIEYVKNMFSSLNLWVLFDGSLFELGISQNHFILLIIHIVLLFYIEYSTKNQENAIESVINLHIILRWLIYLILIFDILLFGVYGSGYSLSGFMYGGF